MVEHHLAKVGVAGSNPVFRSILQRRHSQVVRHGSAKPLRPGSNPGAASNLNIFSLKSCRSGGIGRRTGLKILRRVYLRAGSSPASGTTYFLPKLNMVLCRCGGIGRRARLKIVFREECRFEPDHRYHYIRNYKTSTFSLGSFLYSF